MERIRAAIEEAVDVLDLAARLLRLCREEERSYREISPGRARIWIAAVRKAAEDAFGVHARETLSVEERTRLLEVLDLHSGRLPVFLARGLAEALDFQRGRLFAGCFRHRGTEIDIEPESVVPTFDIAFLKQLYGRNLAAAPWNREDRIDHLRFVRLAPTSFGRLRLVLDTTDWDSLALFDSDQLPRFATAVTNRHFGEFEYQTDVETRSFFRVQPRNASEQRSRIEALMRLAEQERASILVLPELCLSEQEREALLDFVATLGGEFRLVVLGSCHVERGSRRRNESVTVSPGSRRRRIHSKFASYQFCDPRSGESLFEDIVTETPEIRLYLATDATFTVLICKDLLDDGVEALLREMRTTLVLAPSLTPKIGDYLRIAALAAATQGFVIVANNPIFEEPERVAALFGEPRRDLNQPLPIQQNAPVSTDGSGGVELGICLFEPSQPPRWASLGAII